MVRADPGRVLRPGGTLHLADFGGRVEPGDGRSARRNARIPRLADNLGDAIPDRMRSAGLVDVEEVTHLVTRRLGRVTFYRARTR